MLYSFHSSADVFRDVKTLRGRALEIFQEEFNEVCPDKNQEEGLQLHLAEAMASPRLLKSHFPLALLPRDILEKIKVTCYVLILNLSCEKFGDFYSLGSS